MHRLQQYSRRECIEIAEVPNSITDDLLKEHIILIFEKLGVLIEGTVYIYRYIFNLFVILLYIHKASEKKKNICNLNKFCVFSIHTYIYIYIYIYIYLQDRKKLHSFIKCNVLLPAL